MREIYVNGSFVPENEARVSVLDRGFLFADAVYEVTAVLDGRLVDFAHHMQRLQRSLGELEMPFSMSEEALLAAHRELVARNGLKEGIVYLQVTRGVAERDFPFPATEGNTVVLFTQEKNITDSPLAQRGIRVITVEDLRWARCDIKTVQLLYAAMAKTQAQQAGVDDAWMVHESYITEGTSSNAFIVTHDNTVITRPLSTSILHGITRQTVLECAEKQGLELEERLFTRTEAENAREAFATSASAFVQPVVEINGHRLGDGTPGTFTRLLRRAYIERALEQAI